MQLKHRHKTVTGQQESANESHKLVRECAGYVYDTNFSYPSTGANFYLRNIGNEFDSTGPDLTSMPDNADFTGLVGNFIFDWEGGGPEGISTNYWESMYHGFIYNITDDCTMVSFRFMYTGSIYSRWNPNTVGSGGWATIIDDWEFSVEDENSVKVKNVDITMPAVQAENGSIEFELNFWNSFKDPHLVVLIKRDQIDDDYVLLSPSTICSDDSLIDTTNNIACNRYDLTNIVEWSIMREVETITSASISIFIPDSTNTFSYDTTNDTFGPIRKGCLVEIFAGYSAAGLTKRFIGNVTNSFEVVRDKYGATVELQCEGILAHSLDSLNYNYPNNASYSYAGYFSDSRIFTEPNGVTRPKFFDQWNLTKAIETLLLQSNIDPYYVTGYRRYEETDLTTNSFEEGRAKLLTDFNINLSRKFILERFQELQEPSSLWEYEFGKDSAYDIIKDMATKYGYFICEIGCGIDCGKVELIGIKVPISIMNNYSSSSNATFGNKNKDAESFLYAETTTASGYMQYNLYGKSFEVSYGLGPNNTEETYIQHAAGHSGGSFSNIDGYIRNGQINETHIVDTTFPEVCFYYTHLYDRMGYNPTLVTPFFGISEDGFINTDLTYGQHRLRLSLGAGTVDPLWVDSVYAYDTGSSPYKVYSTTVNITRLTLTHEIQDIRNDIVVLGAPLGTFSFPGEDGNLEEAQQKYINSRATDYNSIYNPESRNYIGKNKKFIIEDPTIISQDRADWLAAHTLFTYSKNNLVSEINVPGDLGVQLFDTVCIDDAKVKSIDPNLYFYVREIRETWDSQGYFTTIFSQTRPWPNSFRKRQELSTEDLETYFNNYPIYFEEVEIPLVRDNTAYDPMSSEDGKYVSFEWTLLVPAIQNLEIFDTRTNYEGSPDPRTPVYGVDQLVSVPFVGRDISFPGTYRVIWDGVYDNYENSDLYKDTIYEEVKVPDGNGFFARGQNTELIDEVSAPYVEDENFAAAKRVFFPLYPVVKAQPVFDEHISINQIAYFGGSDGTEAEFDIEHFQLEPRLPIVWDFDESLLTYPSDAHWYRRRYVNPYSLDETDRFGPPEHDLDNTDYVTMNFDCVPPFGFDGTHGGDSSNAITALRLCDDTVGIRVFVDETGINPRRFRILDPKIRYTVVSIIEDTVRYDIDSIWYEKWMGDRWEERVDHGPFFLERKFNFVNCVSSDQKLGEYSLTGRYHKKIDSWMYLPSAEDRDTTDSLVFSFIPEQEPATISGDLFNYRNVKGHGINVTNAFAMPINKAKNFEPADDFDLPNLVTPREDAKVPVHQWRWGYVGKNFVSMVRSQGGQVNVSAHLNLILESANTSYRAQWSDGTTANRIFKCAGESIANRRVWNTVLMSLDFLFIDRAGRPYYSAAKFDAGRFFPGTLNEVEIHSEFTPELMKYVNRYNPYLPTICYTGKNLDTTGIHGTGSDLGFGSNYTEQSAIPSNLRWLATSASFPNIQQLGDLSIHDTVYTSLPHPTEGWSAIITDRKAFNILRKHDHQHIPFLGASNKECGGDTVVFGNPIYKRNSAVFLADGMEKPPRDNSSEESLVSYGIPFYLLGGAMTDQIWDAGSDLPDGTSRPTDAKYSWYLKYVRDFANGEPDGSRYYHARQIAGLGTYLNMSPKFVLVGNRRLYRTMVGD